MALVGNIINLIFLLEKIKEIRYHNYLHILIGVIKEVYETVK